MRTCAEVARALLGDPNKRLSRPLDLRWGSNGSFSVRTDLDRWRDFESDESGDAIDLVRRERRCTYHEALEWLGEPLPATGERPAKPERMPSPPSDNNRLALEIWRASTPLAGTLAQTYLNGRGLRTDDRRIAIGAVLRFHPSCPYEGDRRPCLVALFQAIRGFEPRAIQRIPLDRAGNRARDPAGKKLPKLTLGHSQGAAIMLSHPWSSDAYFGICEGPETGLALLNAGERNVWAMGGSGGIQTFEPVPGFSLSIFADADEAGARSARAAAQRWVDAGLDAVIYTPSRQGADFADIARDRAA